VVDPAVSIKKRKKSRPKKGCAAGRQCSPKPSLERMFSKGPLKEKGGEQKGGKKKNVRINQTRKEKKNEFFSKLEGKDSAM